MLFAFVREGRLGPEMPPGDGLSARERQDSGEARKALSTQISEVKFESVTAEEAFAWLARSANATINVNWDVLELEKVSRTKRVRLHLWDVSLAQALSALLGQACENATPVSFAAHDRTILVSTSNDLGSKKEIVIYNVRDLLEIRESDGSAAQGGAEELFPLITRTIAPDSWRDNGGDCSIREYSGLLLIEHTAEGHEQIRELLEKLRARNRERPGKIEQR
jgi:hypothetical protein